MKAIFEKVLDEIPDYKEFLTVDEMDADSRKLAETYPDIVKLSEIGKTRTGHPLYCLKIGNGSRNALMYGCPHPNEPIGTMMLEYFSKALAENKELREELDYTWYIVKAWDADGLMLNEKWLKGPYTLYNYSRNFFRPAGYRQVDWTFPISYKKLVFDSPIPETVAMMHLIDEVKPTFIYNLHNAGFGGVYWYISQGVPELYDAMRAVPTKVGVPLNLGEPEAPYCIALSPAIYKELDITDEYEYLEKYGEENPQEKIRAGSCSANYARSNYGSFTLLTEMPYFYDRRIEDASPITKSRKDCVRESLEWDEKANRQILDILQVSESYLDPENPFILAIKAFIEGGSHEATLKMVESNPDYCRPATVAEEFDNALVTKFYKLLSFGMLVRANETELANMQETGKFDNAKKEALEKAFHLAEEQHRQLADYLEKEIHYEVIPIRKLVTIQLTCGLLFAQRLHG